MPELIKMEIIFTFILLLSHYVLILFSDLNDVIALMAIFSGVGGYVLLMRILIYFYKN
jgi:hypothetical protein